MRENPRAAGIQSRTQLGSVQLALPRRIAGWDEAR